MYGNIKLFEFETVFTEYRFFFYFGKSNRISNDPQLKHFKFDL